MAPIKAVCHVLQIDSLVQLAGCARHPALKSSHKYVEMRKLAANAVSQIVARTQELEGEPIISQHKFCKAQKRVACEEMQINADGGSKPCQSDPVYARISTMRRVAVQQEVGAQQMAQSSAWLSVPKVCSAHHAMLDTDDRRDFVLVRGRDAVCLNCCMQKAGSKLGLCTGCAGKCEPTQGEPKYEALVQAAVTTVLRFFPVRLSLALLFVFSLQHLQYEC